MTEERWRRVSDLYQSAHDRAPEERSSFVKEVSAGDSDLRREVESLLAEDDAAIVLDAPIDAAADSWLGDNPAVQPGSIIGPYRIDNLLGSGGMGEVYRARDTKLNRAVAIKILPVAFATDPERLARFKREAQVLAALNHPNIGAIYGLEGQDGLPCLVLELVEGPTLADRIGNGPIPIHEALPIARQIADALEAAHEQGIVHRDLKPANIKVREDGTVKVLDFGLAKLAEPVAAASGVQLTQSPTITTPAMTAAGMILGTAAYMSPEQAKGKPADKRSDIWAFGCILYEMLTGNRAFGGEDVGDTLASILKTEPDWTRLPSDIPPSMRRLLVRALSKDKTRRTGDAASLRFDIDDARAEPAAPIVRTSTQRPLFAALLAAIVVAGLAVMWSVRNARKIPVDVPELRVDIATPETSEPASIALSPDGTNLVYVLDGSGQTQLVLRELRSGATRVLPGTEGAVLPFWSPNSRSIAFFAEGRLKRIDLAGGPPRDLAAAPGGRLSGSWGSDGTIIFVPAGAASNLVRINENGGTASPIVMMHGHERLPPRGAHFLPDGRHILFYAIGEALRGVFVGALDGSGVRFLVNADTNAVVAENQLLFQRGTALFAQPFDSARQEVSGEAFQIAEQVGSTFNGISSVSASLDGKVAFRNGAFGDQQQLTWFDRGGRKLEALGEVETTRIAGPNLSHDGRRLAVGRTINRESHVWVYDLVQGGWTRTTTTGGSNSQPVWSPDDRQIAHISSLRNSASVTDVYLRSSRPSGEERVLVQSPTLKGTTDWSPDGRYLLFNSSTPDSHEEIWAYSFADQKSFPVLSLPGADQSEAKFSPDGKWIVFQSNQSGRFQIYVQAFPSGDPIPVSTGGGAQPRWRGDGREIFYVDFEGRLNAARIAFPEKGAVPAISKPVPLFRVRIRGGTLQPGGSHQAYDVRSDGERFLINTLVSESTPSPITLILNWHPRPQTP